MRKPRSVKKPYKFVKFEDQWIGVSRDGYHKFTKEAANEFGVWSERTPEDHAKAKGK